MRAARGFAPLISILILAVLAIGVLAATQLAENSQDIRSKAAETHGKVVFDVFYDKNENGIKDADENGTGPDGQPVTARIFLWSSTGGTLIDNQPTSQRGTYSEQGGLTPGTYMATYIADYDQKYTPTNTSGGSMRFVLSPDHRVFTYTMGMTSTAYGAGASNTCSLSFPFPTNDQYSPYLAFSYPYIPYIARMNGTNPNKYKLAVFYTTETKQQPTFDKSSGWVIGATSGWISMYDAVGSTFEKTYSGRAGCAVLDNGHVVYQTSVPFVARHNDLGANLGGDPTDNFHYGDTSVPPIYQWSIGQNATLGKAPHERKITASCSGTVLNLSWEAFPYPVKEYIVQTSYDSSRKDTGWLAGQLVNAPSVQGTNVSIDMAPYMKYFPELIKLGEPLYVTVMPGYDRWWIGSHTYNQLAVTNCPLTPLSTMSPTPTTPPASTQPQPTATPTSGPTTPPCVGRGCSVIEPAQTPTPVPTSCPRGRCGTWRFSFFGF